MANTSDLSTDRIREKKRRFIEREENIIDASLRLLLSNGIDNVTVSAIAREAGVGKGTVYKHFLSKTEILLSLMLNYERNITIHLKAGIEASELGDPGAAARSYFQARLENPALDRLVQQLEARLSADPSVQAAMGELYEVRRSNFTALNSMIKQLIDKGILEDVPPQYHYMACWALAQGAVEVFFNNGFDNVIGKSDKHDLLDFLSEIGVTMGNRGQLRHSKLTVGVNE